MGGALADFGAATRLSHDGIRNRVPFLLAARGDAMLAESSIDDALVKRLPLPLAQLYVSAHNAQWKAPKDCHLVAFYLWEAALKTLAATAVAEYAARGESHPDVEKYLENLARPAVGHWWGFVKRLVPILAASGDESFGATERQLFQKGGTDLPAVCLLYAAIRNRHDKTERSAPSRVRLDEFFDLMVWYRNHELGHGASGQAPDSHYRVMGQAMLAGVAELLGRLDPLAGRRLIHVEDVRRLDNGKSRLIWSELSGESPRTASLELPADAGGLALLVPHRLYLDGPRPDREPRSSSASGPFQIDDPGALRQLHPLLIYDAESGNAFFLNSTRRKQRVEYLCYANNESIDRRGLESEQIEMLSRVLKLKVDSDAAMQMAEQARAEEAREWPADDETELPVHEGELVRIGDFSLIATLGRGRFGVVYRARHEALGREVALKCMLDPGDPKARQRFIREIRALGRVNHPHLARIFTSGAEPGRIYYAMELIEGATLAAVAEELRPSGGTAPLDNIAWSKAVDSACQASHQSEQPLTGSQAEAPPVDVVNVDAPPPRAAPRNPAAAGPGYVRRVVAMVRQIAEAADALHQAGILHRDIKPGNVMVTADGGHAVLVDLGLARLVDELEGTLSRTTQFVGTMRYASPEQVAADPLDRRSDVYSLGVVLWELLALRPISYGGTADPQLVELGRLIKFKEPDRVKKYQKGIATDLETIVLRCLEKDRDRRYSTARELADDLGRWLAGEPVAAHRPTLRYVVRKAAYRHRVALGVSLVVFMAAVGLGAGVVYNIVQARRDADKARTRAEENFQLALDTNLDFTHLADELKPIAGTQSVTVGRILKTAAKNYERLIAKTRATRPLLENRARMQSSFSDVYVTAGDTDQALAMALKSRDDYQQLLAGDHVNADWIAGLATSLERAGLALAYQGRFADGMTFFQESLIKRQDLVARDQTRLDWQADLASSQALVALTLGQQGDQPAAGRAARTAYEIRNTLARKAPDNTRWQGKLASSEEKLASVLGGEGNAAGALAAYKRSLALYQELAAREPEKTDWQRGMAGVLVAMGRMVHESGDSASALDSLRQALRIAEHFTRLDPNDADWARQVFECRFYISDVQQMQNFVEAVKAQLAELRVFLPIVAQERRKSPHFDIWRRVEVGSKWLIGLALIKLAQRNIDPAANVNEAIQVLTETRTLSEDGSIDPTSHVDALNRWMVYQALADAHATHGEQAESRQLMRQGQQHYVDFFNRQATREPGNSYWRLRLAEKLAEYANILIGEADGVAAQATAQQALTYYQDLLRDQPESPSLLDGMANVENLIGTALLLQKKLKESADAIQRVTEYRNRLVLLEPKSPQRLRDLAASYNDLSGKLNNLSDRAGAEAALRKRLDALERLETLDPAQVQGDYLPADVSSVAQRGSFGALDPVRLSRSRQVIGLAEKLYQLERSRLRATELVEAQVAYARSFDPSIVGIEGVREMRVAFRRALGILLGMRDRGELHKAQRAWITKLEASLKKLPPVPDSPGLDAPAREALDILDIGRLAHIMMSEQHANALLKILDHDVRDAPETAGLNQRWLQIAMDPEAAAQVLAAAGEALKSSADSLSPKGRAVLGGLARIIGDRTAATGLAPESLKAPIDVEMVVATFGHLFQSGRYREAARAFRELAERAPPGRLKTDLVRSLCRAYLLGNQPEEAAWAARQAPEDLECQILLGSVYFQERRFTEARALLAKIPETAPEELKRQRTLTLAAVDSESGELYASVSAIRSVLGRAPNDVQAQAMLAEVRAEQGRDLEQAEVSMRKLREQFPNEPAFAFVLGLVLAKRDRATEALPLLEQAAANERLAGNPVTFDNLGDAYRLLGKPSQARDAWRKALAIYPKTAEAADRRKQQIEKKLDEIKTDGSNRTGK
jgi:serine/threonine protein kinase/tetratricopeptide (TPR) repeat protein